MMHKKTEELHFIVLDPVPLETKRPLWSIVIPTYNCAHYLKETLASVLAQDLGPEHMEIIVVDDHSTQDDPEAVVQHYGEGRVKFIRQEKNVGKVRNYETGLKASKGNYIHQLHGDDMVRPGFYTTMAQLLKDHPDAGAAFCRSLYIDDQGRWTGMTGMLQAEEGIVPDMLAKLYTEQYIQTPSMVVKRDVYETIGTFDRRLNCMEDWEMWIRIANNYPIASSNQVLALYRSHESNATQQTFQDGSALQTHQLVFNIVDEYTYAEITNKLKHQRAKKQAEFWLEYYRSSRHVMSRADKLRIGRFILSKHISLKILYRLLK
ncbi:MAG: glycosyltransferase family 2 protein [Phaeodactylibacter xiamenensis]|uniref:glycosyltransferase family 2 protein n=1 Tax=Phaeodactylibacter xiamenensis TaxID=1524460 RepID=UPI000697BB5C|nr:glycosyltransferase [Phaeodactylibacter xiamenensis]MCR9053992.1 glycosyltransferase [bacterium]